VDCAEEAYSWSRDYLADTELLRVPLSEIYKKISDTITKWREMDENGDVCVILDSLSGLWNFATSRQQCLDFMHYCRTMTCSSKSTFVVLSHSDFEEDGDVLLSYIERYADCVISVNQLDSGFSQDIHGQLKLSNRNENNIRRVSFKCHYHVFESGARFFDPGSRFQ